MKFRPDFFLTSFLLFYVLNGFCQPSPSTELLTVFLECQRCDINYVKQEVNQVNYLRDRADADIHVLALQQRSGSGGQLVTLNFIGKNEFLSVDNSLSFSIPPQSTSHKARELFVQHFRLGLVAYWARTDLGEHISIKIPQGPSAMEKDTLSSVEKDPWEPLGISNYWRR